MKQPVYHILEEGDSSGSRDQGHADLWTYRSDLDRFLSACYVYHSQGGLVNLTLARLFDLGQLAIAAFVVVVLLGIDYSVLGSPASSSSSIDPISLAVSLPLYLWFLLVPFASFWLFLLHSHARELLYFLIVRQFYSRALLLTDAELLELSWSSIVRKIAKTRHLTREKEFLDELEVTNRIMRRENFLIAIVNRNLLPFSHTVYPSTTASSSSSSGARHRRRGGAAAGNVGGRTSSSSSSSSSSVGMPQHGFFWLKLVHTRPIMWALSFALFGLAFEGEESGKGAVSLNQDFCDARRARALASALRRRFRLLAVASGLLSPFLLVYVIIFAFFRSVEVRAQPRALTARHWSAMALWQFREFNELPHVSRARLRAALEPADRYLNAFPSPRTDLIARFVGFICTAGIATLLVLSSVEDDILFRIHVLFGRNGVWWLGVLGAALAATRSFSSASSAGSVVSPATHANKSTAGALDTRQLLRQITDYTHFLPESWRGHERSRAVHAWMQAHFELQPLAVLNEALAVLLGPYLFSAAFPPLADEYVRFVRDFTTEVAGIGPVCRFALFKELPLLGNSVGFGDGSGDATSANSSSARTRSTTTSSAYMKTNQSKLEKSVLNFAGENPTWKAEDAATQNLINSSVLYNNSDAAAVEIGQFDVTSFDQVDFSSAVDDVLYDNDERIRRRNI